MKIVSPGFFPGSSTSRKATFSARAGEQASIFISPSSEWILCQARIASVTYNINGFQPGILAGMENLKPENPAGSPGRRNMH